MAICEFSDESTKMTINSKSLLIANLVNEWEQNI
jgi:hypothetical protein